MKNTRPFFTWAICALVTAVMLAGCSSDGIIDAPPTAETEESVSDETTEASKEETTTATAEETTTSTEATTPQPTEATTPQPTEATTPQPAETTTPKPTETTTPKPAVTTTTTATETTTVPPAPVPDLDTNGIYNTLISFKSKYPEGTPWTNDRTYTTNKLFYNTKYVGMGCAAFAFELSDAAFGDNYVTEHHDISAVRVGDMLRLDNAHTVIVLEVRSSSVIIAEGNFNSSVHWGRELSFSEIEDSLDYIWTRYS